MMDERDLDHAIDTAAGELITREPSRALSYNVMARVRSGDVSRRRGAWLKVASVCAAGIVVAYLAINRPTPDVPLPAMQPAARTEPVPVPVPGVERAQEAYAESRPQLRPRRAAVATRAPMILPLAAMDVDAIEPISADPIAVTPIEVPQLARETTAIENITIEPLTIEPLAASND